MPVAVVDALESIDVDHQTANAAAAPLRAGQFFLQALLQVASIVPAGEEVRDAVLEAYRGNRAQMREKIRAVMARKARSFAAAEAQRAGGAVLARQR